MFQSKAFNSNTTNPMNNICNAMQESQDDVLSEMNHSLTQHSFKHKEQKQRHEAFKIKSELNCNKTKLNKLKRINKKHQYVTSGNLHKNPIDIENELNLANNKHQRYHKLPILTCIELVKNGQKSFGNKYEEKSDESLIESEHEESEDNTTNDIDDECVQYQEADCCPSDKDKKPKRNVLFKDYVLIPSQTKYKHLLRTVFEQTRLNNKHNYEILTGYIKIHNWKPIRLDNISSTPQSPLNLTKNVKKSTENENKNNSLNSSLNSNSHLNKNWPRSNESVNSETYSIASSSLSASPVYSSSSIESASPMSPKSIVTNELDEKRQDPLFLDYVTRNDNNKHRSTRHTNKSTTVYDMLSHVASFSVLHIKLALKNSKEMGKEFKSYEDEEEEEEVEEEQEQTEQQKENHFEASSVETKDNLATKLPETLLNNQSPNLMMQSLLLQVLQQKQVNNSNNANSVSPRSITDILSSNNNTMTSLFSNQQQLANLLPFLNLPILSQMLNNLNSSANLSQEATSAALLNFNNSSNNKQLTSADFSRKNSSSSLSSFIQNNNSQSNLQKQFHQQQQQQQVLANLLYNTTTNNKNEENLSINTSQNQTNSNGNNNNRLLNSTNQLSTLIEASPSPSLSTTSTSSSLNSLHQNQSKPRSTHNNNNNNEQAKLNQPKQPSNHQLNLSTNDMISKYGSNNGLNGNRRQRERTTFDPQEEITRLMQIFEKTHHPTRYQIAAICESLNSLACRKDKKPLEPYNIQYWFKNARAALRRKVKNESREDNMLDGLNNKTNLSKVNNHDENSKCSNYEDDDEEDLDNTMDENDEKNNFDIKAILSQPIQSNSIQNKSSMFNLNEKDNKANRGNNKNYQLSHSNSNRSRSSSVNNDLDSLNEDEYNGVKHEDMEETYGSANTNNTSRPSSSFNKSNNNKQVNNYSNTNGKSKGSSSKRNRVFIDPISEVPILEHYFSIETYPDHYLIEKICDNLNKGEYRYKFPKLESRNIQLWFKNHRAKLKRLKSSNNTNENDNANLNANNSMQHIDNCNEDYSLNDDELSQNHHHNNNNNNNDQLEQQEDDDFENYDDGNYDEEPDDFDDAYDNQDDNKYSNHQQRSVKCESGN